MSQACVLNMSWVRAVREVSCLSKDRLPSKDLNATELHMNNVENIPGPGRYLTIK